jgi:hypothetical protein
MKTVNDMYKYANANNMMLLSNFDASFWQDYMSNHTRYDKLFRRLYYNFRYFMQECDTDLEDIADITTEFIDDVYNHLMANKKKYDELYRIHVISDEEYSITDNYHITETMDRDTTSTDDNVYGERIDTDVRGNQSNTTESDVSPYDNENYFNEGKVTDSIGSRTDSLTKGQHTDALANVGTENYVMTRRGNIGVQTGTEMLDKHNRYWDKYKFYEYIFACICADLLLV